MGNGKVRAVGMGMAMQGSGITSMDVGSASLKLNDDGFYTLRIGGGGHGNRLRHHARADRGRGARVSARQGHHVLGADTDSSPYDSGSYASSTTYVTGKATEKVCARAAR